MKPSSHLYCKHTVNIVNKLAIILWFSVSFLSSTKEENDQLFYCILHVSFVGLRILYLRTTHILSPMMSETTQTCFEYLGATGQVDKSVVF